MKKPILSIRVLALVIVSVVPVVWAAQKDSQQRVVKSSDPGAETDRIVRGRVSTIIPRSKVYQSPNVGSMIPLKNGQIMWVWGVGSNHEAPYPLQVNYSSDGGRTWSDPKGLKLVDGADLVGFLAPALARMPSGRIGMVQAQDQQYFNADNSEVKSTFHVSTDEGRTWSKGILLGSNYHYFDQLIVLSNGRLVIPAPRRIGPTPRDKSAHFTMLFGERFRNAYAPNLYTVATYYSDDEGETWHSSSNEVYASIDRGMGGAYGILEYGISELADGRILMLGFSGLGRIYRSYSNDGGESWNEAEPTSLQGSGPLSVKRIPDSRDVLLIWSQSSRWEAMSGFWRHRLSCAITSDGGLTFHHFKNLESLDDMTRVEPEPLLPWAQRVGARQPIDSERYHRAPGPLRVDHPFCTFHNGNVVIGYGLGDPGDPDILRRFYGQSLATYCERFGCEVDEHNPARIHGTNKVQVIPLDWLYAN